MPLYEYECDACQKRFEKLQRVNDPLLTACPKCGGAVHKKFSVPALQFKGDGFYITDYGRKGSAPSGDAPAKAEAPKKPEAKAGGPKSE
jgi:putative FmdB family regulatory protein